MSLVLTAEISPRRMPGVPSLNELWGKKGKWIETKKRVVEARGARCEICGDDPDQLDLHEVWEYVNAEDAGLDLALARQRMVDWLYEEAVAHHRAVAPLPRKERLASKYRPVVRGLLGLQLLCPACHNCKHARKPSRRTVAHWCRVNKVSPEQCREHYQAAQAASRGAATIGVFYSSYETAPDYRSYSDWHEATRDEADAWGEDDWILADNEMNDSGFLHRGD